MLIFAGPGLFLIVWTLVGQPAAQGGDHAWAFGVAAVILSAVSIFVVAAVASSVKLAQRLGRWAQACVNPIRRLFGKPRLTTWPDQMVAMRADLVEELRLDGLRLLSCVIGGYLLNGVLLVICLWACGASRDELPLSLGLMLYAVGRIATIVQITPGGVGITEIAYTAVYVAVLGDAAQPAVVAGVLIYRAWTYLLPIITGAFAYVIWRVMRRRERRAAGAEASLGGRDLSSALRRSGGSVRPDGSGMGEDGGMPNRLAGATSPYLLQHADNPVDWWPWGDEAFAEARERDVPVLLSSATPPATGAT